MSTLAKQSNLFVDLQFEISLDSKFLVQQKFEKMSTIITNSIDYFEIFN